MKEKFVKRQLLSALLSLACAILANAPAKVSDKH
jgi:hypothetical protein